VVTDDLTFDVRPNELHAVIGPNGAGKTTLINQISGLVAPDAGSIVFAGRDITALSMHARAGLGLARTFQVSSILPGFSALENVALAVQGRSGSKLLLLDEPMAGTGRDETTRLVRVLGQLKGRFSVVLVEHDMTAVFALADRISVLIYGHIIATGAPAEVRADPRVVAAYLGDEME
jgi:branched-chain amino acid transport system ATP-binding protein